MSIHRIHFPICLIVLSIMLLTGCVKEQTQSSAFKQHDQSPLQPKNTFKAVVKVIRGGDIAEAMRWKRATILSPWVGGYKEPLLNFLRLIEDKDYDLDSVLTSPVENVPALGDIHLYLLLGWSGSGLDEMRMAAVDSVNIEESDIRIFASRPRVQYDDVMAGTDDMKFIGWDVNVGKLKIGSYTLKLFVQRDLIRIKTQPYMKIIEEEAGYSLKKTIEFDVIGVD